MNKKNDILESWIMVEHLSEGDINLKAVSYTHLSSGKQHKPNRHGKKWFASAGSKSTLCFTL